MFWKIVLTLFTLLTVLGCLALAVWAFTKPIIGLGLCCTLLGIMFGYFSVSDVRYWINYFKAKK